MPNSSLAIDENLRKFRRIRLELSQYLIDRNKLARAPHKLRPACLNRDLRTADLGECGRAIRKQSHILTLPCEDSVLA